MGLRSLHLRLRRDRTTGVFLRIEGTRPPRADRSRLRRTQAPRRAMDGLLYSALPKNASSSAPGSPVASTAIAVLNLDSRATEVLKKSNSVADDSELAKYFSAAQAVEFPTGQNKTAFGLFYPAYNPDYEPPRRRPASAGRQVPWRTHCRCIQHTRSADSILDQPWHRRARRELRRQHRFRTRLSRAAELATGASSMSKIA